MLGNLKEIFPMGTNTMSAETIGRYVREKRKMLGLTQGEVAAIAGVGVRFLSELERGKETVRLDRVNLVLAVFGDQVGVVTADRSGVWEDE